MRVVMEIPPIAEPEDLVIRNGLVQYWAPDGEPCSPRQWRQHYLNREEIRTPVGNGAIFTLYLGMNLGHPLPPWETPRAIWVTVDEHRRRIVYSYCRDEAMRTHFGALAEYRRLKGNGLGDCRQD